MTFQEWWDEPKTVEQITASTKDIAQQAYAAGRDELVQAVRKVHAAKGRYHSQIAMCDLYNLCVLPHERPMK